MPRRNSRLAVYLHLLSALTLLLGLGSAAWIYHNAENRPAGVLGYEAEGGQVYPVLPEDSKQYQRGMELYGGQANVLADRFRRWLEGFWQGKSLAVIIAGAGIILSFGLFRAANRLSPYRESELARPNRP